MDISVHNAKEAKAEFYHMKDKFGFATIGVEDSNGASVTLFIQKGEEEFVQELHHVVAKVIGVMAGEEE